MLDMLIGSGSQETDVVGVEGMKERVVGNGVKFHKIL